jgi:FAD/FMN-containing dehydrogenase
MTDTIEVALHRLCVQLPGRVSKPGDERYIAATSIWAKSIGALPRVVVHCRTREDVQTAIRAARDCGLPLSVRGGGHDWAGRALCEGLVLDLSDMNGVTVDRENFSARIAGGARMSDVVGVTDPLDLTPVAGSVGAVGMTGFTLGGGYGALIGRFGLALDNLIAAEVVLADGRTVIADEGNEVDLYWALRGGGGNFGVVTAMHHRLHELSSVRTGMLFYRFSEAGPVLAGCAEITGSAPEELTVQLGFAIAPDGVPVIMVVPTWCGRPEEGEAWVAPFLKLGTLLAGTVEPMSYQASLTLFDPYLVNGQRALMETCWLPNLHSGIAGFIEAVETVVSPGCAIFTHEFRGAASRVPLEATAFGLRRDHLLVEILATFPDRSDELEEQRHRWWARGALRAFDSVALPGGYSNLLAPDDAERAMKSYGPNGERLRKTKRHYDPDNVFRSAIPLPAGSQSLVQCAVGSGR